MTKKRGVANGSRKVRKVRGAKSQRGLSLQQMPEERNSESGKQAVLPAVRNKAGSANEVGKGRPKRKLRSNYKPTQILDKMPKLPFVAVSLDWQLIDLQVTSIVVEKKRGQYIILRNHIRSPLSLEEVSEKELKAGYAFTNAPIEHVLGQYDYMMCVSGIESKAIPVYEKLMREFKVKTTTKAAPKKAETEGKVKKHVGGKPGGKPAAPAKAAKGKPAKKESKKVEVKADPNDKKVIHCIEKENPRKGEKAKNYELFIKGSGKMTVAQYREKGGSSAGLTTAIERGWVKLK